MRRRKVPKCGFCGEPVIWAKTLRDGRLLCRACEVCIFFETHLTLTGDFAGQPFTLMPWVRATLRDVFGTLDEDGLRRYRDVYQEVPKKNSKTTICAGIVTYLVSTATMSGTEVYSAATAHKQAAIVWAAAAQMVQNSPTLSRRLKVVSGAKRIVRRDDPTTFYSPLSADGDINDGMQPSFVVRDELHRWRTRKALELNEILERGMIARREPLVWDITTAGIQDESPLCYRRHEYTRMIQEQTIQDRRFYGQIFTADLTKHEWDSKEARVEANPSHEDRGGYLKDSTLEDLCQKAKNDPHSAVEYKRYHLNIWDQKATRAINLGTWVECGGPIDLRQWPEYDPEMVVRELGLADRPCAAGVDASWTTDLTSLVFCFPPHDGGRWVLLSFYWMPAEAVRERERIDKVPYSQWVAKSFIEAIPGHAVDPNRLMQRLRWGADRFQVRVVGYDPWNFRGPAAQLSAENFNAVEVKPGYSSLSGATKKLLEIYKNNDLWHCNHPVLNWNAGCAELVGDGKDNVQFTKPERSKSSKRVDGISATVTAMSQAMIMLPKPKRGPYLLVL